MVGVAIQISQLGVVAQLQGSQVVVIAVQLGQCSVLAHIQCGQLVVAAGQRGQGRVPAHIQRGQLVVAAPQPGQGSGAAHVQRRQLVVVARQRGQGSGAAQVQRRQLVVAARQMGQLGVAAHVQSCQLVGVAIQISQGSEVLNALEVCDAVHDAVNAVHCGYLSFGQTTVARRVKAGADIAAEILIREVDFVDQQVAVFIHLGGGAVEGALAHGGILRHGDGQGNRHGIGFHNGVGVVVVADFHAFGIIRRGGKGQNAGFRVIAAAGDIAHAGQVFHAHKAAQIQQQLALLPIGGRGRCLRCASQVGQSGVPAHIQ